MKLNWSTQQTVAFADGRVRVRHVHCLGKKNGARVGEAWIGDRMAYVTEIKFGTWREEGSVLFISCGDRADCARCAIRKLRVDPKTRLNFLE